MGGAIVHEWISQAGGSENVLEAMSQLYPDADIHCLWNDSVGRFAPERIHETWLSRTPLRRSKALALPFMPAVWRSLDNNDYEWALISSHLFAHHARFNNQSDDLRRFVYVHTPARYIWDPALDLRGNSAAVRAIASTFKPIDRRRANEPASFAANSGFVRARMKDAWGVDSRVIYPPVNVTEIQAVEDWSTKLTVEESETLATLPHSFVLGASRFIPYKRLDLVIQAGELSGCPVVIAGKGPELAKLRALAVSASVPVHIVVGPSAAMLNTLYQSALIYVFPAIEDFGIMPVEAMAAGTPVLAHSIGGTAESVVPGLTGALVSFDSPEEIYEGFELALATKKADREAHARTFAVERFRSEIFGWVGHG